MKGLMVAGRLYAAVRAVSDGKGTAATPTQAYQILGGRFYTGPGPVREETNKNGSLMLGPRGEGGG